MGKCGGAAYSLVLTWGVDQRAAFHTAAWRVVQGLHLDQNITVSVFETNIRVVGGLLSAHTLMVMDLVDNARPTRGSGASYPDFVCHSMPTTDEIEQMADGDMTPTAWPVPYDGQLLDLAERVARRLLPAFDSPTGIPYGSVHLMDGVSVHVARGTRCQRRANWRWICHMFRYPQPSPPSRAQPAQQPFCWSLGC